jgi:hypothetical protein
VAAIGRAYLGPRRGRWSNRQRRLYAAIATRASRQAAPGTGSAHVSDGATAGAREGDPDAFAPPTRRGLLRVLTLGMASVCPRKRDEGGRG